MNRATLGARGVRARRWPSNPWVLSSLCVVAVCLASVQIARLVKATQDDARYVPVRSVSLQETETPKAEAARAVTSLRVAVAPVMSPEKSLRPYRDLVHCLAEELDATPVIMQRDTYLEVNDLVRFGRCDVAFVCTYPFVRGEREFGMEALVVPQIEGQITYHSLILVPASSEATTLLDLKGQRFGSADLLSNTGWLYPALRLKQQGEDPEQFFGQHVITGSHDRSVSAVASAYVEGAAVNSTVYEQMLSEEPGLGQRAKVLQKSPPFGMPPVVVGPHVDHKMKARLREAFLGMHETERGKRALRNFRIERFVVPDDALFDSVRDAALLLETGQ